MSTLLKDYFTEELISKVAERVSSIFIDFDAEKFSNEVLCDAWINYELKERYHHMALCLRQQFHEEYNLAIKQLVQVSDSFKEEKLEGFQDLVYFFIPAVIEDFGGHDLKNSVWGMERVTQLVSCEFAIRQFFISDEEKMLEVIKKWSKHESLHVRRLATEGCRPALPWGKALTSFKKDPHLILEVLEQLKNDSSFFVRKSVANNLNDISKTHPELMIEVAKRWKGATENIDWIIKHGARTLLKQGNVHILPVFGYLPPSQIDLYNFHFTDKVKMGQELEFGFSLKNSGDHEKKVRIEYVVSFLRKNGEHNNKTFMISDRSLLPNEELVANKRHSFKKISTRVYYYGKHFLCLRVNGMDLVKKEFNIV